MRHKFPVLTVKQMLKSVSIYGSYRKNKTGTVFLEHPVYTAHRAVNFAIAQLSCLICKWAVVKFCAISYF